MTPVSERSRQHCQHVIIFKCYVMRITEAKRKAPLLNLNTVKFEFRRNENEKDSIIDFRSSKFELHNPENIETKNQSFQRGISVESARM